MYRKFKSSCIIQKLNFEIGFQKQFGTICQMPFFFFFNNPFNFCTVQYTYKTAPHEHQVQSNKILDLKFSSSF